MGKSDFCRHMYCVFCKTGAEYRLREEIGRRFPNMHPLVATQEKHRIIDGHEEIDRRVFLPGYLFLYAEETIDFDMLLSLDDIYRILGNEAVAYELQGSDRAFAEWLLVNDGMIGMSVLRNKEGKITILSGPMKYFAKSIARIDKHTRNARVRMDFMGTVREMWLAFRFEDEAAIDNREDCTDEG